jgi:hypothetical protein
MNRRNLFQACAAGLAWLATGKLPAFERNGPHPVETCGCEKCRNKMLLALLRQHGRITLKANSSSAAGGDGWIELYPTR